MNEFQENLKINLKKSPEELLKNRLTNVLIGHILSDYKRVLKENEILKEVRNK